MAKTKKVSFIFIWFMALLAVSVILGTNASPIQAGPQGRLFADNLRQAPALGLPESQSGAVILVNPFAGPSADPVTVFGQRWEPGSRVIIYLLFAGQEHAVATTVANTGGAFVVSFFIPSHLAGQAVVTVQARTLGGETSAQAFYNVIDVVPKAVPTPTPTSPQVVVTTDRLNVRSGPGIVYPVVGQVRLGQVLDVTGTNSGWWRISFLHAYGDFGWISGAFADPQNTGDVLLVQAPPTPIPPPTPTPTPIPPQPAFYQCNPGQWSGCSPSFCPVEYVSQCQADGTWGQCIWDPGHCSTHDDDDDDEEDHDDDDDDSDDDDDDSDDDDDDSDDDDDDSDDDDDDNKVVE